MEPILSKPEIADLLRTLQKKGGAEAGPTIALSPKSGAGHVEISLLKLPAGLRREADLPNVDLVVERFRAAFARALSRHLQRTVTISTIDSHTVAFADYLSVQGQQRITAVVDMQPLPRGCLLNLDSHLWFLLLEILLGGERSSASASTDRGPTQLELSLLGSSLALACQALDLAFQPLLQITSSIVRTARDEQLHSFVTPDSSTAIYRFEVSIDQSAGILELIFPLEALAPYRDSLEKLTAVRGLENKSWWHAIAANVGRMPVTLSARSCAIDLSIRQLIDLKVGDVLPIPHQADGPVEILVEGIPKFSALTGQKNNQKNIQITKKYDD